MPLRRTYARRRTVRRQPTMRRATKRRATTRRKYSRRSSRRLSTIGRMNLSDTAFFAMSNQQREEKITSDAMMMRNLLERRHALMVGKPSMAAAMANNRQAIDQLSSIIRPTMENGGVYLRQLLMRPGKRAVLDNLVRINQGVPAPA